MFDDRRRCHPLHSTQLRHRSFVARHAPGEDEVRIAYCVPVLLAAVLLAACDSKKDDAAAYETCIAEAKKPGSKFAAAKFPALDKAKINSQQDGSVGVAVPVEIDGKEVTYNCNVQKQQDNTFKVNYTN
jgi:hypothetical protein